MKIRDFLGSVLAAPSQAEPPSVGDLELAPHQSRAVAALVERASTFGGALLADAVGLGKTRVCLATALRLHDIARVEGRRGPIWFVVPARIVPAWEERAERAGVRDDQMRVVTHTAMSRRQVPAEHPSVLVVDEAHRFRNPNTRRYEALSNLAANAPLILATATPVANSREDLRALLSLFVGDNDMRPWVGVDLSEAFREGGPVLMRVLERLVVRRTSWGDGHRRPAARLELLPYDPEPDEAWVWAHLGDALAAPIALLEGDWPQALFVEHVLRLWESGPRALAESLARLVAFHERWLEARRHGETISRIGFRELFGNQPQQSVLPFMFAQAADRVGDVPLVVERVEADLERIRRLTDRVELAACDVARERAILRLIHDEPGKLLVFTSFRSAARSIFEALAAGLGGDARVGIVTGDEARATGLGRVDSHEVLRRFSPGAFDLELPEHQALDVLVATDCIAEGVDLHDCGRIVLADLPYSPLRVEQRVGRLLRPGSPHEQVVVHLPRPRNWNDSLGMRRRLRTKLGDAAEAGTAYATFGRASGRDPLAALTLRDGWLRTLGQPDAQREDPNQGVDSVVVSTAGEDALWAIARLGDGSAVEDLVVRVSPTGGVSLVWDELMTHVDELTRGEPEVVPGPGRQQLVAAARAEVADYVSRLNAARLAPFALSMDSVGNRAFRAIVSWAAECDFCLDVDELRTTLLRPWPRGLERRIAGWIEEPWRGARYYRDLPGHPATARLRVERFVTIDARYVKDG